MKRILTAVLFAAAFAAICGGFLELSFVRNIDNILADKLILYFSPATLVSDDVALVLLDEATMKDLPYRSPVPRDFLYKLNERLLAAHPKAIGYDIYFKDPTLTADDQKLAASFKKGSVFAVSAGRKDESGGDFEDPPMELFSSSLKGVGLSDLPFSASDAVVRFAQFEFPMKEGFKKSFVAAINDFATGGRAEAIVHDPSNNLNLLGLNFSPVTFHRSPVAKTRIRFTGAADTFRRYPAGLVAEGLIPPEWLKDKIVLVGAAYDDGTDAYITPYYAARYNFQRMPGVEIHANILNQLLTRQFYYNVPVPFLLVFVFFFGAALSVFYLFGPIWRGVAAVFAGSVGLVFLAVFAFNKLGLIIPLAAVGGSNAAVFGLSLGFRSITEGRQKRFIKGVFAKYVPPSVVDKMIANPRLLTLGGEVREITCMFTDIAGFTSISEKLDPSTLVRFLNDYLDRLTRVIFKHSGTLDKYEGDAIIAFFGAPLAVDDHKQSALLAAIEMQKACAEISREWKDVCGREITTRIGLNSGKAVVGNMGSDLRFDYTAIGDTVNLASRLEGANKFFDTRILASENVVSSLVLFRPVARLRVKGKKEAVRVFEVGGMKADFSDEERKLFVSKPEVKDIVELTSK